MCALMHTSKCAVIYLECYSYRWQQISIAMNGRRTPRQVASRVQKYFEKLKRFGVGSSAAAEAV